MTPHCRPAGAGLRLAFVLAVLAAVPLVARSVQAAEPLRPTRLATPPVLDGVLREWEAVTRVSGFKTWRPDYGIDAPDQTVVYAAYDAEHMYFAFRVFDREPSKIKASMASRDSIRPDDWICINLDSFNDQQALYAFYVNPLGIQMDSRFAANREDVGFDMIWHSAGRIDESGYVVEMSIPFKSIRYSRGSPVTMGVVFERSVSRRSEGSTYPPLDPRMGMNFNIQTWAMVFTDIQHYTLLEVLPDATYTRQHEAREGLLRRTASKGELGITAKYGLTPQLTVDGTYNPDFSQVEADAGQIDINLRHPLFFAEKRPFFLEGNEVFNLGGPTSHGVLESALHTRTIVNPVAGAKVSGKVGASDTLAALYALDESGPDGGTPVGARAKVSVLRYKRSLNQDAYVGGFYVGREQGAAFGRLAGVDGLLRLDQSTSLGFHAFGSDTRAGGDAAQRGHAVGADLTRETRRFTLYLAGLDVSEGFQAQSGYLTRNGVSRLLAAGHYRFYPRQRALRRIEVGGASRQTRDAFSGIWETVTEASSTWLLPHATTVNASCDRSSEVYLGQEFGTTGCDGLVSTQLRKELRLQVSLGRRDAIFYSADPFGGRSTRGSITAVFQPYEQWYTSLAVTYAGFWRQADGSRVYDYTIVRNKTTFQVNRYLFFRGILEYNGYRRQLLTDFLGSFTYLPGTVIHAGYGSLYERQRWDGAQYVRSRGLEEARRGLFLKASYLWRM